MTDIVMWQDIVKKLGKRSSLALMYLAFGEDCPYNMAENFEKLLIPKNGWNENRVKGFKTLKISNEVGKLLDKMESGGLLISRHENEGRKRHLYRLNSMILYDFSSLSELFFIPMLDIANIDLFLDKLSERVRNPSNGKLDSQKKMGYYFKLWSSFETFDYITFIQFLELESGKLEMNDIKDMLHKIRYQYSNFDTVSREIDFQIQINKLKD